MAATSVTAAAPGGGKIELHVSYPKTAAVGETFLFEITVTGNPGLCAAQVTLEYDKAALECVTVSTGPLMSNMMTAANPNISKGAIVVGAGTTLYEGDGVLVNFRFKVLKGDYDSFTLSDSVFTGAGEKNITFDVSGITHKVNPSPSLPPSTEPPDDTYTSEYFTDTANHWAAEYIDAAFDAGLVDGYGGGLYGPGDDMNRAQFMTVLWRSEGEPEPNGNASFSDLDANTAWSHEAIAWGEKHGIIYGVGGSLFDPYGKLTREQMATILFRMSGAQSGSELLFTGVYDSAFSDSGKLSSWAKSAVYWAVYNEIWCGTISADIGTALYPNENASRAEMALMLIRFHTIREGG